MSTEAEFERLLDDVRYLMDRTAILDCIAAHARGCDRHDDVLITGAYHDDAVDEHGFASNLGPEYADWANEAHASTSLTHTHNITTHSCTIDGDVAHAESYVLVVLLGTDGVTAQFITGRYIDRLERRSDGWRIALRRSTVESMFIADASVLKSSFFTEKGYIRGTRDRGDLSYHRPLDLRTEPPERW
jgi:hypothetical protein